MLWIKVRMGPIELLQCGEREMRKIKRYADLQQRLMERFIGWSYPTIICPRRDVLGTVTWELITVASRQAGVVSGL